MRIAYVGRFAPGWATERDMATALERAGDDVVQLHEADAFAWESVELMEDFDLVVWTTARQAHDGAERALRMCVKPVVGYHLDRWWGLRRQREVTDSPFFDPACVDLLVTADGGHDDEWRAAGMAHRWLPPAIDRDEAAIVGEHVPELAVDVAFVGNWRHYLPDWPHRRQLVAHLRDWYGDRFGTWPAHGGPAVRGKPLADLYASAKVVVGDSCLAGGGRYWSDRIPETLGRGGFLLHPAVEGLGEHFKVGEHLATWPAGNWRALRSAIDYWLAHPEARQAVATAGRSHVLAHHTYDHRAAQMLYACDEVGLL